MNNNQNTIQPAPGWARTGGRTPMKSVQAFNTWEVKWYEETHRKVSHGGPMVVTIPDESEEVFTCMDIPVTTKMRWANLALKAQGVSNELFPHYFDLMEENNYDVCRYCARGYACSLDDNPQRRAVIDEVKPTHIIGNTECDASMRMSEVWAREIGAYIFPLELNYVSGPGKPTPKWWERMADHWDEIIEPYKIDMKTQELRGLIKFMEVTTDKKFTDRRLREVMQLSNEQNEYFKKARDLIATTHPCPVTLSDQISIYQIQWHRGKEEIRDFARMFYEETVERVKNGYAPCPQEKVRLMWMGTGLWTNPQFYDYFEEKYGAVFVCSMYLSIGGDAYPRHFAGKDPLRALASRGVWLGLGSVDWMMKEIKLHSVNGAVQIGAVGKKCHQGSNYKMAEMMWEKMGVPMVTINADSVDYRYWNDAEIKAKVSQFIEQRLLK